MNDIEREELIERLIAAEEALFERNDGSASSRESAEAAFAVVEEYINQRLQGAVDALEWIERFTSDRGDARGMDPGQVRALIHRRAALALREGQ